MPGGPFLALLFNLPMDAEQTAIALACTGLETLPEQPFTEAWLVVGRRGGKSLVLAMIAIFLALFKDWSANLVPGERGTVLVLAAEPGAMPRAGLQRSMDMAKPDDDDGKCSDLRTSGHARRNPASFRLRSRADGWSGARRSSGCVKTPPRRCQRMICPDAFY
jgi:hypothetical protein